ncbi:TlpA disulfide reductase family protein [Anaerolinea thermophila]|uniref:TlpA family protein disulfide reductase n=1 Tax=Anaerolinea thermophila TaxID=167964 RepID=UPI0026ED8265|nr:TlpA disulfide reductase family protein [Anaerolinea thermophila]
MNETAVTEPRRLPVWAIVLSLLILLAFLALIGWGLKRSMSGPITVGQKVPEFQMTTFDGESLRSTDFVGKVIVLNFWASWCKPCEQEARELEEAYQYYKDTGKVVFLGLAYVDTEYNSKEYLKKFGITYPNGPDLRTSVSQMFRIRGVPETYIIDQSGKLAYVKIGPFGSTQEIIRVIDPLLSR